MASPSSSSSSSSSSPAKRRRVTIEVPDCPVCLRVAAPVVLLECDHVVCGPCVRRLEGAARPVRSANFACPTCRWRVRGYSVPAIFRAAALEAADAEQHAAADDFMREYSAAAPPRAPPPSQEAVARRALGVLAAIPRHLTAEAWRHDGAQWRLAVANAFAEAADFRANERRPLLTRLASRLRRGGMRVRRDGTTAIVTLQVLDVARFADMQWPDAAVRV